MDRQQRGEQLFGRLVRHGSAVPASVFPQSSTWSWLRDPVKVSRAASLVRTGLGMLELEPASYGLGKLSGLGLRALGKLPYLSLNTLLPEEVAATTLGSRAAFASGLAGGLLAGAGAFIGIWGGLAEVGKAKLEGQKIAQARLAIGTYVNKYAETLAGHAQAIDESSAYQPQVTAGLSAWLKPWEQRAIADAHAALKTLGEQDGRAVLQYLQDSYGEPQAMARALRKEVLHHSLKHVSPQLRRSLNLTGELGGGAQTRTGPPQPKVEQGIQIDEHTVYWPQRKHTDFTKPFVIETQIPRRRPFTRINTPFVIETQNPHQPSGGSSRPSLFQQLNQQLQRLDAGPGFSPPQSPLPGSSSARLDLSNLKFGGSGGSFSIVPSLSRSGGGFLRNLWNAGTGSSLPQSPSPGSSRARQELSNLKFGGSGGSFSIVPSLSRSRGGFLSNLWDAGNSYRPATSSLLDNSLSLRDVGSRLSLESLRQDAWHNPWRGPSSRLSLGGFGGGPLSNLWNAGSSFSSASPSSIRLSTSPKLSFNPPAWQGAGGLSGGPSLSSFARGL
jgi:hypothetical protein